MSLVATYLVISTLQDEFSYHAQEKVFQPLLAQLYLGIVHLYRNVEPSVVRGPQILISISCVFNY
jgi:hypothetical protein